MRAAVVSLAFTCLFSTAYAECIPGKYAGTGGEEGQDPFPILIAVTCEGDVVGGLIETVFGNATVTGGETSADRWRLEATFDSAPLRLEAARNGEAWTGHYDLAGQTGALNLRRDDAATFAALSAQQEARLDLAVGQWREDLAFLAREIPARHANAFHTIDRQAWAHAVSQVDARLPSLNGAQTAVALRELVARIGDGHTSVQLPPARRLPLRFFWFGGELRIVEAPANRPDLIGARVLRIGGSSIRDAARAASRLLARENRWADLSMTPYLLRREDVLDYLGFARTGSDVALRIRQDGGRTRDVALGFADADSPMAFVAGEAPLYRQRPDQSMWFTTLSGGAFYINFRAYDNLRTNTTGVMAELDRRRPPKVVLDMRDNGGGDFTAFRETMLAEILARPWLNRADRLYVVIGREMFSAAMSNAADLTLQTNATLAGEPIGERPNSYQEVRFFALPNSRLRVGVSVEYYEALPGTRNPDAIGPDISAPPTWVAFRRGEDDALNRILRR
jgi:hypothetical protein